jgi:hypothetical protein
MTGQAIHTQNMAGWPHFQEVTFQDSERLVLSSVAESRGYLFPDFASMLPDRVAVLPSRTLQILP